jgi:hypothetical protein
MKMLKMCLNPKVLAGLVAVGVVIYLIGPNLIAAALPILLLAACPLSMLLMMWSMQHTQGQEKQTPQERDVGLTREEQLARLRALHETTAQQIAALERTEPRSAANGSEREMGRRSSTDTGRTGS